MQINWFTVIAQLVNFLVLVWLMKKYLYKPILHAVDEREKKIATELADAKAKKTEAKIEQDEFLKKNDLFDSQKKKMMAEATFETGQERQKLLDAAHKEAAHVKLKLNSESKTLQKTLNDQLVRQTQQAVFSLTKKALTDMASTTLEAQSIHVFIKKIRATSAKEKTQFLKAFESNANLLLIKSAFNLSDKEQSMIKTEIETILGGKIKYEFKTDPKMISGIELATNGYKLSWSFSAYINSLEKSLPATEKEKPEPVNS
ncbi:F-type H+-transporting ATPase subunit b [Pedobacter sp. UYEF25]